jgi:hypothetical protein
VVENRFADAANGYYRLAEEHVRIAQKAADGSCFPLSHCLPCCFTTVQ